MKAFADEWEAIDQGLQYRDEIASADALNRGTPTNGATSSTALTGDAEPGLSSGTVSSTLPLCSGVADNRLQIAAYQPSIRLAKHQIPELNQVISGSFHVGSG